MKTIDDFLLEQFNGKTPEQMTDDGELISVIFAKHLIQQYLSLYKGEICDTLNMMVKSKVLVMETEPTQIAQKNELVIPGVRQSLIDFLMSVDEVYGMHERQAAERCVDDYLKSINVA